VAARRSRTKARSKTPSKAPSKADREFICEAEDILERMRDDLSSLAEQAVSGEAQPELVNSLFRSAHSLKGLSGMFGLRGMSELAHHLEGMLDRLRLGRVCLGPAALGLFDESVNLIGEILGKVGDEAARSAAEEAIAELVGRIDEWGQEPDGDEAEGASLDLAPALLRALTEYEEHRLRESVRTGRSIHAVEAEFAILAFEEGLSDLSTAIREAGELISTLPSPAETAESRIRFSILVATELDGADLARRLGLESDAVRVVWSAQPGSGRLDPELTSTGRPESGTPEEPATTAQQASLRSLSKTVRVDIRKLDELMTLVGELAIQTGALKDVAARVAGLDEPMKLGSELQKIHKFLERKLQELQAGVLDVRMVPLSQVFDKMSRVVRRLRVDLQKEVRLEVQGADTELDKLIVEELVDPLMHLVRNAFDHAIEAADEREACGKPVEGCIRLEATQRGNDVVIAVSDDGRGIDSGAVLQRARERGLVDAGVELTEKEILGLVFQPGLSTRSQVTETSGRGVGMDVVRANIGELGGIVDIDSTPGRGTTVSMTLPITLAIIRSLVVGVGRERFAIPLNSVRETLLVEPSEVQRSDGREMLNLRGDPLLLTRLGDEFGLGGDRTEKQYAVVLSIGDQRMGLLVDRLEGQQDTVVKPIRGPVSVVRGIAGATELGEQGTVLVLDVSALVEDGIRGIRSRVDA
jgi:two-component system chemotaxis sensor kinase CheA